MKKHFSKFIIACFILVSVCCLTYVETVENHQGTETFVQYEDLTNSTDRMLSSVKTATLVVGKVVDFLTRRETV